MTESGYSLRDILQFAIKNEKAAEDYYRAASEKHPTEGAFLAELAEMEKRHKELFESMLSNLSDIAQSAATDEGLRFPQAYLAAILGPSFGEGALSAETITGKEKMEDLLHHAVNLEKESVLLYIALKERVSASDAVETVDDIINEEIGHVAQLQDALKKMRT